MQHQQAVQFARSDPSPGTTTATADHHPTTFRSRNVNTYGTYPLLEPDHSTETIALDALSPAEDVIQAEAAGDGDGEIQHLDDEAAAEIDAEIYAEEVKHHRKGTWNMAFAFGGGFLVVAALVVASGVLSWFNDSYKQIQYISITPSGSRSSFPAAKGSLVNSECDVHGNETMVVTNIKYASVYPENSAVTLQISTTPCGDLAQYDVVRNRYLLVAPMNLTIESTVFQYSAGVPMADREAVLPFASGDINNYPFEVFESNVFQVTASNGTSRIGVEVRLTVSSQNFTSNVEELLDISDAGDGTVVSVKVVVQRSFATKAVSIFVMFAMWLLSGFAIALAVTPWILHQKVESPAIIFVLALLFSLPQIRNVQPGVPAVGCTSDVVSFFWSMVLASVSAALLMLSYIYHSSKLLKLD